MASERKTQTEPAGSLHERLCAVRYVVLDVDGVLTDGGIIIDDEGRESKRFCVYDGSAVWLLRAVGIECAIVSGRYARCVELRAAQLRIEEVHQGARDKLAVFREICARRGLEPPQCAYVGDDILDVELLRHVGLGVAPANARAEARAAADLVLETAGGAGAVRELAERILRAQGRYDTLLLERYGI